MREQTTCETVTKNSEFVQKISKSANLRSTHPPTPRPALVASTLPVLPPISGEFFPFSYVFVLNNLRLRYGIFKFLYISCDIFT